MGLQGDTGKSSLLGSGKNYFTALSLENRRYKYGTEYGAD
jgi:hypothetical protein